MTQWRIIIDGDNPASFNMAADDFLFEQAQSGAGIPTLRLYGWECPSITIGYHQRLERAVDIASLLGTPVVRRVTGGRALLHDAGEITYAVAGDFKRFPELGKDLAESYHRIAEAIIDFYADLGWDAVVAHRDSPVLLTGTAGVQKGCFASVSRYEVMVGGMKSAASSQRRNRTALIQHGAIRFRRPVSHSAIVESENPAAEDLIFSVPRDRTSLVARVVRAFQGRFQYQPRFEPFTAQERSDITARSGAFKNLAENYDLIKQAGRIDSPNSRVCEGPKGQKTS